MATDTEQSEREEPEVETTMDGGLARLELPGLASIEGDDIVAPRHERKDGD
jgi:hypothetical protein